VELTNTVISSVNDVGVIIIVFYQTLPFSRESNVQLSCGVLLSFRFLS